MAQLVFRPAEKQQAKLRLGIYGPSGAGKTLTALRLSAGMNCGKVAVIDTEHGSASMYADRYEFDVLELPKPDIETYTTAIGLAAKAGYPILVIDSLTHAWQDLLDSVDRIARARYSGNRWSAWSEATPMHRALVNALLGYPGHIIATMRTKTDWAIDKTDDGKVRPVRIGLAPEQGKGIEYEFDLLMEINPEHIVTVIKDRTGRFQDRHVEMPGEELGQELIGWLREGKAPEKKPTAPPSDGEEPRVSANDWITEDLRRRRFWAWTHERGLSDDFVHQACGVDSMYEYAGSAGDAFALINKAITDQMALDTSETHQDGNDQGDLF